MNAQLKLNIQTGQIWSCQFGYLWKVDRVVRPGEYELESLEPSHLDTGLHWRYCRSNGVFYPTPLMPGNQLVAMVEDTRYSPPPEQPHDEEQ
jgi:hypothetical protein